MYVYNICLTFSIYGTSSIHVICASIYNCHLSIVYKQIKLPLKMYNKWTDIIIYLNLSLKSLESFGKFFENKTTYRWLKCLDKNCCCIQRFVCYINKYFKRFLFFHTYNRYTYLDNRYCLTEHKKITYNYFEIYLKQNFCRRTRDFFFISN